MIETYPNNLEIGLVDEIKQFRSVMIHLKDFATIKSQLKMLKWISDKNLTDIFPNVFVTFRIFLCIPITSCEAKRSFLKLTIIKTKLRTLMNEQRLCSLAILSIENDLTSQFDFGE